MFSASGYMVWGDDSTDEEGGIDRDKLTATVTRMLTQIRSDPQFDELSGWDFFHNVTAIMIDTFHAEYNTHDRDVTRLMLLALRDLPDVGDLDLQGMPVNDSDLEHVILLKELRRVDLTHTKVTAAGAAKLRQALPNCRITR
ncbi:MAG: hypothetical protein ACLP9L_28580 [Thermoguttaceae bacterium]